MAAAPHPLPAPGGGGPAPAAPDGTLLQRIVHRLTGAPLFEGGIEATPGTPEGVRLGLAVRLAFQAGARLGGADLRGAHLEDVRWGEGATWAEAVPVTRAPVQVHGLAWPVWILDRHMQVGCELHALAEWEAFDDRRVVRMDGRRALDFWRGHKESLIGLARANGRPVEPSPPVPAPATGEAA